MLRCGACQLVCCAFFFFLRNTIRSYLMVCHLFSSFVILGLFHILLNFHKSVCKGPFWSLLCRWGNVCAEMKMFPRLQQRWELASGIQTQDLGQLNNEGTGPLGQWDLHSPKTLDRHNPHNGSRSWSKGYFWQESPFSFLPDFARTFYPNHHHYGVSILKYLHIHISPGSKRASSGVRWLGPNSGSPTSWLCDLGHSSNFSES